MKVNTTNWNRVRYGLLAPVYDMAFGPLHAVGFRRARARAMDLLGPSPGSRLLIVGCGTGLDLPLIPPSVDIVATDLSPHMVERTARRARRLGLDVETRVMDGEHLDFEDASFDHVVLHLILAVMPDPLACAAEVARVLRPGGTVSIFDKFAPDGRPPSLVRRGLNLITNVVATDITRGLQPILEAGGLQLLHREEHLAGLFSVATARGLPRPAVEN